MISRRSLFGLALVPLVPKPMPATPTIAECLVMRVHDAASMRVLVSQEYRIPIEQIEPFVVSEHDFTGMERP